MILDKELLRHAAGKPGGTTSAQVCASRPCWTRRNLGTALIVAIVILSPACKPRDVDLAEALPERIEFNKHIRPILNKNCASCHGGVKTAGGVSFVYRESAIGVAESGERPIVPGNPDASELIRRITSDDPDYRMPEADHAPPLKPREIALLRQWIAEGAEWQEHWAFIPPERPEIPGVGDETWPRNPVDRFILARLEREGLAPSPEADRAALLRRASLDLTGLPPTIDELDTFLADDSPDAFEKQVDRLLASPAFGERWATVWLDLARYADSKGYEKDSERTMWPWRDWVVRAFNANQPYDEFLIDQLAGDLRPNATFEQRIATAFHRNTPANDEGGTDDEEFRVAAVIDRVATTWSALNGVTFQCVQCHSHPYDPIRHEEFYKFAAFFNNTADADFHLEYPVLRVPTDPAREDEAASLERELASAREDLAAENAVLAESLRWSLLSVTAASSPDDPVEFELWGGEVSVPGTVRTEAAYDLLTAPVAEPTSCAALRIEVPPADPARAAHTPERGFIVTNVRVWVVDPEGGETPVRFAHFAHDAERMWMFSSLKPKPFEPTDDANEILARRGGFAANPTLDRTRWVVGVVQEPVVLEPGSRLKVRLEHGRQITEKPAPVRRVRVALCSEAAAVLPTRAADLAKAAARIEKMEQDLAAIDGVDLPVVTDLPPAEQRETRVFERGNFMEKVGVPLEPDVPGLFPPLPEGASRNRLGLARWLVSADHPLTARVAVNRFWEQLFGTGIVRTTEDFGGVGEGPSHPELLDWLAVHFQRDLDWDVKAFLKLLVTSATYRQTAAVSPELWERDPGNRLLAHGPRQRLTAEMIRDQALFASGLLSRKMGGPPVMPPQPEGVWAVVYNGAEWVESEGEDRFRRALYTYLRRSAPYPSFVTFDMPSRSVCVTRRMATNTPLQALVTLNDPVYHEAAIALAKTMQHRRGTDGVAASIREGVRRVTSVVPDDATVQRLGDLYEQARELYAAAADTVDELGVQTPGEAAMVAVASAVLNLDAAMIR